MSRLGVLRGAAFFGTLVALPSFNLAHWVMNMAVFVLMFAVMSSAWNLVGGFAGYPSLGHAAFFGIGAYAVALWYKNHELTNAWHPFLALPLIALIAALVGLPIAMISMRTRADVFAIVTITVLFVAQTLAFNLRSITDGAQGLAIPPATFSVTTFERPFYYVLTVLLAFAMAITWASMRSKIGLALSSVRADEDKARGVGVHVTAVKLLAFCVSVGITAMVGAIWAYYESFNYPQFAIDPLITIAMVLMTFLGGRATLWGPVVGALVLETAQQVLAYQFGGSKIYLIAYALVFLLVMLLLPRGILPTIQDWLRQRRRRLATDNVPPPSATLPPAAVPAAHGGRA
jgi:branched-chain amino acid transport system permease protein